MDLVDPRLGSEFNKEEVVRMINVALLCTNPSPALRPTMSAVLSMLEGQAAVRELATDLSIYGDGMWFMALRNQFDESMKQRESESCSQPLISLCGGENYLVELCREFGDCIWRR
uniref:Putative leucine-rich repeat receptor-like serine/threonine-protein kinase At3g14840 n=1 Tax=Rhizophora mucronata TaxID=61149 RepID=A0A2P2MT11_RHIMU